MIDFLAHEYLQHPPPAQLRLLVSPLIMWIWLGGLIVFGGGLLALSPSPGALRRRVALGLPRVAEPALAGGPAPRDILALELAREVKYRELRDVELDLATGKLSREDYEATNATLRAEALEILNQLQPEPDRSRETRASGAGRFGDASAARSPRSVPVSASYQGFLSRMMVFPTNRIAKKTVQRLRLRSTSEPPPSGPWPVPTPNAPESPASFPSASAPGRSAPPR